MPSPELTPAAVTTSISNALSARPDPDVVGQRLGDDAVLIHLQTNRIYELNPTAARVWELLGAGEDLKEISRRMLTEYDVPEEQLDHELHGLLTALAGERLLTLDAGA
jgi:hypothetical protein